MRRIKIVQIGVGHDHASAIWDCLLNMPDIFDFAAFAVPDVEKEKFPERIAELSKKVPFLSIDEALSLPGLDAAAIETEEVALTDCALAAAEKGLHIHMDKPGGLELAAFEKLIDILKAKKACLFNRLHVSFQSADFRGDSAQNRASWARYTLLKRTWTVYTHPKKGNGLTVFPAA